MKKKVLYIEKKRDFDRSSVAAALRGIKTFKMSDVKYTIDGEDISFLSVETSSDIDTLKHISSNLVEQGFMTMYSGVIHATAIAGVVRHGNCLNYMDENNPGMFMQTDIIDNRCMITFPLVENRHVQDSIKFIPLDIPLPTDFNTVERRIKSMYVLQKNNMSEIDYVENVSSMLAIATMIYPPSLIWNRSEVPPPIERLLQVLNQSDLPLNTAPAYMIMNDDEREYLQLYLYVELFQENTGDHLMPMNAIIPPSLIVADNNNIQPITPLSNEQFNMGTGGMNRVMNARSYEDLEDLAGFMRNMARNFFGNTQGTRVRVSRRDGDINIQFEKRQNGRGAHYDEE